MYLNIIDCIGDKPLPRIGHSLIMIDSCNACLFGGATGSINEFNYLNDTYIYRIKSREWIKINFSHRDSILPCKRGAHAAAANDNKQMVIYGGSNKSGLVDDKLWILNLCDQNEGIWSEITTIGPTPGPRYGHSLIFMKPFSFYLEEED